MRVGTKSVLFGAHAFWLHPWFVALAWWRLYGWRRVRDPYVGQVSLRDWRLWLCFAVHDLGYWGKRDMDGEEGEQHPYWAARLAGKRLNRQVQYFATTTGQVVKRDWYYFLMCHSRFLSKRIGQPFSLLCPADKLAVALEPWWLYLPRVMLSGEVREYMKLARTEIDKYGSMRLDLSSMRAWHRSMCDYLRRWAYEHRDGRRDRWTPQHVERARRRQALDEHGTWR